MAATANKCSANSCNVPKHGKEQHVLGSQSTIAQAAPYEEEQRKNFNWLAKIDKIQQKYYILELKEKEYLKTRESEVRPRTQVCVFSWPQKRL
uniref:Uncharacterized protein n=1 Tax=Chlorocebus sabaeus TaxID=60711 RepID=A0A0D9RF29_CHLSB